MYVIFKWWMITTNQWRSQVIGIGLAPTVCLTNALTALALTSAVLLEWDELWPGTCPARPGLCYATVTN